MRFITLQNAQERKTGALLCTGNMTAWREKLRSQATLFQNIPQEGEGVEEQGARTEC
jgi:hypothetical protein